MARYAIKYSSQFRKQTDRIPLGSLLGAELLICILKKVGKAAVYALLPVK